MDRRFSNYYYKNIKLIDLVLKMYFRILSLILFIEIDFLSWTLLNQSLLTNDLFLFLLIKSCT